MYEYRLGPFITIREVHISYDGLRLTDEGWRFGKRPLNIDANAECNGFADNWDVLVNLCSSPEPPHTLIYRVSVHGDRGPMGVVTVCQAAVQDCGTDRFPNTVVTDPLDGLLDFLNGSEFRENELPIWETKSQRWEITKAGMERPGHPVRWELPSVSASNPYAVES